MSQTIKKKKIGVVAGTRPNFVKVAPILNQLKKELDVFDAVFFHTGQHYDEKMSDNILRDLGVSRPDVFLGVGSGTHVKQLAKIMESIEYQLASANLDLLIVVGDVNSTLAAALAAKKMNIRVAHVESGLRSFDDEMPEELNRRLVDHISDYLFVTEQSGIDNLKREGISEDKIFFVGNVMIDSLFANKDKADSSDILSRLSITTGEFATVTLHRPSNVDSAEKLSSVLRGLRAVSEKVRLIFPVHPRTRVNLSLACDSAGVDLMAIDPLGYHDFIKLISSSRLVLTDSGGIQEETTALGVPCLTLRLNTERPVTIDVGTNELVGDNVEKLQFYFNQIITSQFKSGSLPEYWDGRASERIVNIIKNII